MLARTHTKASVYAGSLPNRSDSAPHPVLPATLASPTTPTTAAAARAGTPWSTRYATWWTSRVWVAKLPVMKTPETAQKRQLRSAPARVQCVASAARSRAAGVAGGADAGGSRSSSAEAGIPHPTTRSPSTRSAQRQPTRSMRSCASGTRAKMPTPMPAEARPRAVPTREGNQPRTRTTEGTHPELDTPTAAMTPKAR